jgi:N-acetyl-1-D-myo-inositol-2-amino-2-deoxy-alpha-D-glucopyranoside deacetylase
MTRNVLAVFAHPDDEVLCGAGTLALCAAHGVRVHLVCATRGELGPIASPALATHETLGVVREAELRASCAALGIGEPGFLDLPDSGVEWAAPDAGTLQQLTERIRELAPSVILTFGPDGLYGHSDHIAIGELTTQARQAAGVPARLFYAVMSGESVAALLDGARAAGVPDSLWRIEPAAFAVSRSAITASVDVSAVLDQKLAALRCHRTQLEADNVLGHLTPALARDFFGVEHFRCADGRPGTPLTALDA